METLQVSQRQFAVKFRWKPTNQPLHQWWIRLLFSIPQLQLLQWPNSNTFHPETLGKNWFDSLFGIDNKFVFQLIWLSKLILILDLQRDAHLPVWFSVSSETQVEAQSKFHPHRHHLLTATKGHTGEAYSVGFVYVPMLITILI